MVGQALSEAGHESVGAADGEEALKLLKSVTVDLAIVDRNMPGISGVDVIRAIRANPKTAALKVLMCTGDSVTKDVEEAFAVGANDYVLKPINFPQLLAKVGKALGAPKAP